MCFASEQVMGSQVSPAVKLIVGRLDCTGPMYPVTFPPAEKDTPALTTKASPLMLKLDPVSSSNEAVDQIIAGVVDWDKSAPVAKPTSPETNAAHFVGLPQSPS